MISPTSLLLSLQYAEQLDPTVRSELEQLIQALQNWAGKLQSADGNLLSAGMGTFLGQPICKLFKPSAQSIPNDTDTVVTWGAAKSGSPLEEYDDAAMFDGSSYIVLRQPGLYIAQAEMEWATNGTGYRVVGIHPKISAVDYFTKDRKDGSATIGPRQVVTSIFPVKEDMLPAPAYSPFPLQVGVQVYQNSGGALNIGATGGDRFGVWKIS